MYVCIVGFGLCGKALYEFCLEKGFKVCVFDDKIKASFIVNDLNCVKEFDFVIVSPGVRSGHKIYQMAIKAGNLISEMQFSLKYVLGKKIAITGTNGKSSACTLLYDALKKVTQNVFLAGNIGIALISIYKKTNPDSIIVLELSSYQLELLEGEPFEYGAILNIQEDHLDSYKSFDEYKATKLSMFKRVKKCCYFEGFNSIEDILLKLASHFDVETKLFIDAKNEFKGLRHRIEPVLVHENITFINDSKSTSPASTLYAINQFKEKIYLLVGGFDKGLNFDCWQKRCQERVEKVFVIGVSAKKIENSLSNYCEVEYIKRFSDAFDIVFKEAKEKVIFLFSPGCSSFDEYRDYAQRGDFFVRSLDNYVKKRNSRRVFFDECCTNGYSFCRRN